MSIPKIAENKKASNSHAKQQSGTVRTHCKVSIEDVNWVRKQSPAVQQLWLDCIAAEQFMGNSPRQIETTLDIKGKPFRNAKQLIISEGLFSFVPLTELLKTGQTKTVGWKVTNCHGFYNKKYWEDAEESTAPLGTNYMDSADLVQHLEVESTAPSESSYMDFREKVQHLQPESLANNELEKSQLYANHTVTISQLPTKVVEEIEETTAAATEVALLVVEEKEIEKPVLKVRDIPEQPPIESIISEDLSGYIEQAKAGIKLPSDIVARIMKAEGYRENYIATCQAQGLSLKETINPTITEEQSRLIKEKLLQARKQNKNKVSGTAT